MSISEKPAEVPHVMHQTAGSELEVRLPPVQRTRSQDEEWFEYRTNGAWRRLLIHDYQEVFKVPGLYEALVYDALKCSSPRRVVRMLAGVMQDWDAEPNDLRVLDLGAGNGVVAEHLREVGVPHIVGVDLLQEAADAAERDRPGVYDDFIVADLCNLTAKQERQLDGARCNCLVTVAALGFGDIPPRALARALAAIDTPGWIAMAIKEDFLTQKDPTGFAALIQNLIQTGAIEVHAQQRYCHRLSIAGEELHYVAMIGRKLEEVPDRLLDDSPCAQ